MSKPALQGDTTYDKILAHCLDPDSNALSEEHQRIFHRWNVADDLLRQYPRDKQAYEMMRVKFPELSRAQIYRDLADAKRLFNYTKPVDKEFIRRWVIDDCLRMIQIAMNQGARGFKAANMARAQLIKAARLEVEDKQQLDPDILSKHNFFTVININGNTMKIDMDEFLDLPVTTRKKLSDALFTPLEDQDAIEIMNS